MTIPNIRSYAKLTLFKADSVMYNKSVLVLGANLPHCVLIEKLRRRGYYINVMDYLDNPPGRHLADNYIQESILSDETVCRVADEVQPLFIANLCNDRAVVPAAKASELLKIHNLMSLFTAQNCTDKCRMKEVFIHNGIKPLHTWQ